MDPGQEEPAASGTGFAIGSQTWPGISKLVEELGVAAIPVSAFYREAPVRTVIRFCFAKQDAVLDAALERLAGLRRA